MSDPGVKWIQRLARIGRVALLIAVLPTIQVAQAESAAAGEESATVALNGLHDMPPGERYRQLSLLLLLTRPDENGLLPALQVLPQQAAGAMTVDDYTSPLARIADPDSMLAGAAQMMLFASRESALIAAELEAIRAERPILVSMIDQQGLIEDAIIIRTAIADALQYAAPPIEDLQDRLAAYREETIRQRDQMEYLQFQSELDLLAENAVDELEYKLGAYQRMADEEFSDDLLKERIGAAENMSEETRRRYQEQAYIRASTLYLMLIPAMVSIATN